MNKQLFDTAVNQIKKRINMGQEQQNPDQHKHAETVIKNHIMVSSTLGGFIIYPIVDVLAVGAVQLDMIRQLCKVYDIPFKENEGKAIVSALTSSTLVRLGTGSLIKFIPWAGTIVGGIANSLLAGASTYALGHVFKRHFETGGTILDLEVERFKKMYRELFEKGKEIVEDLHEEHSKQEGGFTFSEAAEDTPIVEEKEEEETPVVASTKKSHMDTLEELQQLAKLKEADILTEAEFQEMKQKIISSF